MTSIWQIWSAHIFTGVSRFFLLVWFFFAVVEHFIFIYLFNWSIVDLQCCVNFCCTEKWFNYTYNFFIFFSIMVYLWFFFFNEDVFFSFSFHFYVVESFPLWIPGHSRKDFLSSWKWFSISFRLVFPHPDPPPSF